MYTGDLFVSILVAEQRFRNATVERDETGLIVLVAEFVDHDEDFSEFGNDVVVVAGHQVWVNKSHTTRQQRFRNASVLVHGVEAQDSTHVRQEKDSIIHILRFEHEPC